MSKSTKNEIIKSLNLQKEIFGDEMFIPKKKRITRVVKEPSISFTDQELFPVEKQDWEKTASLNQLEKLISNCTKCRLHSGRNKFVFGTGNPNADVLVIGEGPGAEEDKQGLPFVGRAGQLLTDMLPACQACRTIAATSPPSPRGSSPSAFPAKHANKSTRVFSGCRAVHLIIPHALPSGVETFIQFRSHFVHHSTPSHNCQSSEL